jgi:phosphoenolpyruvate-protein kinase (PTS system EI component)
VVKSGIEPCVKVLANADTPEDAKTARDNGAEGIGGAVQLDP